MHGTSNDGDAEPSFPFPELLETVRFSHIVEAALNERLRLICCPSGLEFEFIVMKLDEGVLDVLAGEHSRDMQDVFRTPLSL